MSPTTTMRNCSVHSCPGRKPLRTSRSDSHLLLEQSSQLHEFRHFHQLFRRLHHGNPAPATATARRRDLGHFDNLLGDVQIEVPERFHHQLVPTLRHRSNEDLHEGTRLNPVHHNVPLNPFLRHRVRDQPWPALPRRD